MNKRVILALTLSLFVSTLQAAPVPPAMNKDGSVVSGFLTAEFDLRPGQEVLPLPTSLLFGRTNPDLTLDLPVEDPTDFGDPLVALNALDGWSPTERWITTFSFFPNTPDYASVVPGQSVRLFEVSIVFGTVVIVDGIVRELTPGVDYFAQMANDEVLAIIPLKPLKEMTAYMAVLTNDINDTVGNDATPSQFYHLTKFQTPWVNEDGSSVTPFFDDATAQTLESARQITFSMEEAAASVGIPKEDIILSWTAQTQSITPVTKNLRSIARPAPTQAAPTGTTTADLGLGLPGIADIYAGVITLPYYLGVPNADNPIAPLEEFWTAAPGAYVPPFDTLGLDPNSTNVTVANPFPVKTGDQTVPLLVTLPNVNSGHERPAAGWPVVVFQHGITRNRTDALGAADALAAAGYAMVAMDLPLHGLTPQDNNPLYVENTPWAPVANERTFDVDYIDNATGAPGQDGIVDPSGAHIIQLPSLLTSRDNLRQAEVDLSVLTVSLPLLDVNGDSLPDLDASNVQFAAQSLGSIVGVPFIATEPMVTNAFLSVPMGGIARGLEYSESFGPRIRAGLAALGLEPGTAEYELFFTAAQTVIDSGDPINWAEEAARLNNIVLHEVIGDTVVPNFVPTAPLSGTEPLIATMGLKAYSSTQVDPNGVDAAGRFVPPASHGSLLDPTTSPAATVEMQKQLASSVASKGTAVVVENAATMVPIPEGGPDDPVNEPQSEGRQNDQ